MSQSPISVGGIVAVEATRTVASRCMAFDYTTIVNVLEGVCEVHTHDGVYALPSGTSLALGAHREHKIIPRDSVRTWTVYADEAFWRAQMSWFLPDPRRVRTGVHPSDWDGGPLVVEAGLSVMREIEPLWRRMSLLGDSTLPREVIAARSVELLARWVGRVAPSFLDAKIKDQLVVPLWKPIRGRTCDPPTTRPVSRAVTLLRARLREDWSVDRLAREVALSPTHLNRVFVTHAGASPMRFLTELRLTTFTRLIEETNLSVARAADAVGWSDPRVASHWFRRRYGMTPTEYRRRPHAPRPGIPEPVL